MRFFRKLLPFFLLCSSAFAALNSTIVWEARTTGAQTNGGGWKPGASGTDYSQQAAAQYALTTVTSLGATATMTHASAAADMVGNTCRVVSGTNATLGWYEIISVNVGTDITVDRNWCTGACNNGVVNVGGAFLIGGTLDDDFFEAKIGGNTIWIAPGTYTLGESVSLAIAGATTAPIIIEGYSAARGDNPTGTNRPLINGGTDYRFGVNTNFHVKHLRFTGEFSDLLRNGGTCEIINCKATNTGITYANRYAFHSLGTGSKYIGCEGSSIYGMAFYLAGNEIINTCYAHDSTTGFGPSSGNTAWMGCVIDSCQTGIDLTNLTNFGIYNSTIRNCKIGISGTTANQVVVLNSIIADCLAGALWTTAEPINYWDYNCWSNNDTDVTLVSKGDNDVTADALLGSSIAEGADGATGATGLVFTAASNPFGSVTTADCLNIIETGTGATLGVYGIASVDGAGQLTLTRSAGANKANIDYRIVLGTDFTLSAGSPCFNTGLKLSSDVGL